MNQDTMEKVFMETFATYGDAIFSFCLVKVSNVELAEDMTQEVFMRYWQYLRDGKAMSNTRSFLYTIANNLAKDWYKKKKADSLEQHLETKPDPADTSANPEVLASHAEVLEAIEGMEPDDKTVLLLRYVEELPPREIATILDVSPNVVSVRLNRATKRLHKNLHL